LLFAWSLVACGGPKEQPVHAALQPAAAPQSADTGLHYADVTQQAGINFVHSIGDATLSNLVESVGGGAAWLDYDQDGYLDLYVVSGRFQPGLSEGPKPREQSHNHLYHNNGDGTFTDVTERAGVAGTGYGMGVTVGDYDNDGYPDIYVTNDGPNVLYHNNRNGTFTDVTRRAGVAGKECSDGAVWLDYDNDGLLDLYVGNYVQFDPNYHLYYAPDGFPSPLAYPGQPDVLYHNRGDGSFEDVTQRMGIVDHDGRAMGVGAADYDGDGYVDIYVANDHTANYLWHNLAGKRFEDVAVAAGVAFNERGDATSSMTAIFGDYDGDGRMDLFVPDMTYGALYRNEGGGVFTDRTYASGVGVMSGQFVGWAAAFIDYDNDGDLDLFQVDGDPQHLYGQQPLLFENEGRGAFRDVSIARGSFFKRKLVSRGAAFGDYDNDGDIDVFIVNLNDRGVLLRNEGGNRNHWLEIHLVGQESNRDGIGARLTVRAGDLTRVVQRTSGTTYLSTDDPRLHVGLGTRDRVDRIEVIWPSGIVQAVQNVAANQVLTIREPAKQVVTTREPAR
jgi:hypothetical protein